MGRQTSKLISMKSGKKMRVDLGSLYVLDKPISAYKQGSKLLTDAFEILVVMSVAFSRDGNMAFYVIAIRKCSLFKKLGSSFKKLRKLIHRMADSDQVIVIYCIGRLINNLIENILKIARYYSKESEIIGIIKLFKNNISEIIEEIRGGLNPRRKPQDSKLVELVKNNIDKIIGAMLTNYKATVSIKRKHLFLFKSYLWCESCDVKNMKWHKIGRMVDIKQWPIDAIRLWAKYQLRLPPESFEGIIEELYFFSNSTEIKKNTIESIQRYNVSKKDLPQSKNLRHNESTAEMLDPLLDDSICLEDGLSEQERLERKAYLRMKHLEEGRERIRAEMRIHQETFGR